MTERAPEIDTITIQASAVRRAFMATALAVLGACFVLLGFNAAPELLVFRILFIVIGAAILAFAPLAWRATARGVVLDGWGLSDTDGNRICPMIQIRQVERGAFAFKPSNGFLIRTRDAQQRGWAPGIWWRFGRKVGIGGVLPASQAKFMADTLALRLRDASGDPAPPD